MRNLEGKVAVVTGAGHDIGRETALALANKGCRLAICDLNEAALEGVRQRLEASGATVTAHLVDVSDKAQMAAFASDVIEAHGEAHILVNHAGVTVYASFEEHSIEDLERIIGVNLWGVIYGCKFFLPHLKAAGEGHIVNLSSVFGIIAPPLQTSYVASKFAVRGFSESLRAELADDKVGVTSVHPGPIKTDVIRNARLVTDTHRELRKSTQRLFDRLGTTPDVVAARIVKAIEYNSPRVLITRDARVADALKRLMPATTDGIVARVFKRVTPE
ncbi:MAG: SDR family NAD(P)-dependent oxidoreductase [Deltaproteobacteria bacterium]|nr:SDR family NAD(P)-dependent oxidoreductase [Deltaproteobacteria bacterium]MBW2212516.1 SDR family NAD(P)-dependent oxidoreductase [Deltaproteobacteria bacterium]MBW2215257.1 SDR family NAD(P)-dependent oxidoreductase [Deltaproteobacteria bacterium]